MRRALTPLLILALAIPGAASAAPPRASLTDIENDVMCVACHEPLAVAQSPQADAERAYILMLIRRGDTKAQIERQLVAQYGSAVLARPPAHGFSVALYVLPPALVALGLAILALTLPRWRQRARAARSSAQDAALALSPAETERVEQELTRYDG